MIWRPENSLERRLDGERRRWNEWSQDMPVTGLNFIKGLCPKFLAQGDVAESKFLNALRFEHK